MKNTSNNTAVIILLIITFPIWIGLAGGALGLLAGIAGLIIGLVAGAFGLLAGLLGAVFGFFGWMIDGVFDWNFQPVNILISPLLILAFGLAIFFVLRSKKQTAGK